MDIQDDFAFRTIRGYQNEQSVPELSPAMEDYLETVGRLCARNQPVRTGEISAFLHVKPSSASKMVAKLRNSGHLMVDRNGTILMTAKGKRAAAYLLHRHEVIERFLTAIGSEDARRETELIEHFLSPQTVKSLEQLLFTLEDV